MRVGVAVAETQQGVAQAVERVRALSGHADMAVRQQAEQLARGLGYGWVYDLDTAGFLAEAANHPDILDDLLWMRAEFDRPLFCVLVLGDRIEDPFSALHRTLLGRPKTPWKMRRGIQRWVDAAPRGAAKSTIISFAEVLHDIVYGYEAYVVLLSNSYPLSEDLVRDIHRALSSPEQYEELHRLYGPFTIKGGETSFVVTVPGGDTRGVRVSAFSFGGQIRGTKHAGIRPTKAIIDDGEHPDGVRSPAQREKLWSYLVKDVLKVGDRRTVYQVAGTVLHPESMLSRLLKKPGWTATKWKSIIEWPTDTRRWETCRELWADLTDPHREETARRYYERNREKMDAGGKVLWPEREPLFDLHEQLWADGAAAFSSEKQNEAVDPDRQCFDPDRFRRCVWDGVTITTAEGRRVRLSDCELAWWLDPRASEQIRRNDYAAGALVAQERLSHGMGYAFVLEVLLQRPTTAEQLGWVWSMFDRYGPRPRYGYEDNGFQVLIGQLVDEERQRRRRAGKSWNLVLSGHTSTGAKMDRIMRLAPHVALGWIQFARNLPPEAIEQFRQVPTGAHDDGPDAIERALWLLQGGGVARAVVRRR